MGIGFEELSDFRKHDAAAVAVQELHAEFRLEQLDLPAQDRLGDGKADGRFGKTAGLRDFEKVTELPEFHRKGRPAKIVFPGMVTVPTTIRLRNPRPYRMTKGLGPSPTVSIQTDFSCRYSRIADRPLSRPMPERL